MVCGTASDVGKSHVVAGLCRVLARQGVAVAPFKAQNMALNSFVTTGGHEIGRAQAVQSWAAGAEPEVAMNPILLKPTGERTSQVIVMGAPVAHVDAASYQALKPELLATVTDALADLRRRFDVVVLEGAGSPAEINLAANDLVNLRLARLAGVPAIVVGDIDRGGVFAALYGTVALLEEDLRRLVRAFVINKLRGDPALLGDATLELERRCGVPTLGVIPHLAGVELDAEDSLALGHFRPGATAEAIADRIDVAVLRFPRIANFTDFDPLFIEPGVSVRLVDDAAGLGGPDLVILPGTKATVADLEWVRARGLDRAVNEAVGAGATVLGICGGYQMMGRSIVDYVESGRGSIDGLGWLDSVTNFGSAKVTRQRRGSAIGHPVWGYEIHHGRVTVGPGAGAWIDLADGHGIESEGVWDGSIAGTSVHGLFEADAFRAAFLEEVARRRGKSFVPAGVSFTAARDAQIDTLADALEANLDMAAVEALIKEGAS